MSFYKDKKGMAVGVEWGLKTGSIGFGQAKEDRSVEAKRERNKADYLRRKNAEKKVAP